MLKVEPKAVPKVEPEPAKKPINKRKLIIWVLLVIGFGATEFPGILFAGDKIYPRIFGLPFLYGYILCCWLYIFFVLVYACKTRWGKVSFFSDRKQTRVSRL